MLFKRVKRRVASVSAPLLVIGNVLVGRSKDRQVNTSMGPRPSISGELPIDSYFGSTGKTAGTIGNKENGLSSLKRTSGADADNESRTSTKRQKTKQHTKGTNLRIQEKSHSVISGEIFGLWHYYVATDFLISGSESTTKRYFERIWDNVHTNTEFCSKAATIHIHTKARRYGKTAFSGLLFSFKWFF